MYTYSIAAITLGLMIVSMCISASIKIADMNEKILCFNKILRYKIVTVKELFALCHEYIEMWKRNIIEKIEGSANLFGEILAYYLMHKIFAKRYKTAAKYWKLARLFM